MSESGLIEEATSTARAWAVVLAGGEGTRLRSLIRQVFGDERPKQYAPLVAARSLLRQTLDRTGRLIPLERTAVVSQRRHAPWIAQALGPGSRPKVLMQPENRDTAAGVLLPVYWVAPQDPDATVAVFPSDHFVLEESVFLSHVGEVVAFVERNPAWLVLLGARATAPDPEYGWIEPGDAVGTTATNPVARVLRFREKPTAQAAASCLARGWLWNTFVFVAKAATLISVAEVLMPELHRRLASAIPFFGTGREEWALQRAYANLPAYNFSRTVLAPGPPYVAVSTLPPLTWSDLGTPQRVFKLLRTLRMAPAWMHDGRVRPGARSRRTG